MNPLLVAAPESTRFTPPTCIDRFGGVLMKRHLVMATIAVSAWATLAVFAFGAFLHTHSPQTGAYAVILSFIAVAIGIDAFASLNKIEGLTERALFFYWLHSARHFKVAFAICVVLMVGVGAIQLILQKRLGSFDSTIKTYGLVFSDFRDGQLWRVIIGPFFHSGPAHYLTNFFMLLFVGPIVWAVLGPASVFAFLLGNTLGPITQMYFGSAALDSYVGVSAGVFALFGLLVTSSLLEKGLLPKGFGLLCAWMALISAVGTELLLANAATAAHVSGFVVGAMCACVRTATNVLRARWEGSEPI